MPYKDYVLTGGLWLGWCVVHSLLNGDGPVRKTGILATPAGRYYRFFYTIFAVVSLILVSWLTPRHHQVTVLTWGGVFKALQIGLWSVGGIIAFLAFRFFSGWSFLGLDAFGLLRRGRTSRDVLFTRGIYGSIRHPQFLAALIFLWARNLTDTDLTINLVLSGYLLVGARIEEKRLLTKWGAQYGVYMNRTGGFIPKSMPSIASLFQGTQS